MRKSNLKRQSVLAAAIFAGLGISQARATNLYWDQDGNTSAATGGTGNWNNIDLAWRPGSTTGTPLQAWVDGNDAVLPNTAGTMTLGGNIVANSIEFGGTGAYTILGGGNTLNVGTIRLDNSSTQLISADFAAAQTSLTVTNNNAGVGTAGATLLSLQGAQAMASTLTTLNIGGGGAGASYSKNNQVNLWNPFVDPFVPGVFNDPNRNPWAISTTINVTGDYAMLSGSTPGANHAATHIFTGPVHLNNNILLLAAPLGNSLQFNNVIDSTGSNGGVVITGTTPTTSSTGQGAVIFGAAMTYAGPTRIMNTFGATNGGILRFLVDNALPTSTQLIWGDVGFNSGYMNLNGTDQTVGSIETTTGQQAGGIFDNNANHFHDGRGYRIVTVSGNRTSTFAAPIGQLNQDGDANAVTSIQLNFPVGNTGSTTLTNAASQYSAGTIVAGGIVISKNTTNDFTNSPVGTGAVTVSNGATFGGTGQVIGPVSHSNTSHSAPGGVSAIDTTNPIDFVGGLTLNNTPNLDFEFNGFGNDLIKANTSFDLSGATTVNLNLFNLGSGIHNGDFTLIDLSGSSHPGFTDNSKLNVVNLTGSGATFALNPFDGNTVSIHVTGAANTLVWKGTDGVNLNSTWNTSNVNWSGPSAFTNGDFVTFDDTADGSAYTVTVAGGGVLPATMTVNASNNYVFNGGGISSSSLLKHLGGTLTFNQSNTFSGGITADGGTIAFGASGSVTGGGAINMSTATLSIAAASNISGAGTVTLTNSTLTNSATLSTAKTFALSGTNSFITTPSGTVMTLTGAMTGTSATKLTKNGDGTLIAGSTVTSSLNSPIDIDAGKISVTAVDANGVSALGFTGGPGSTTLALVVKNGATFDLNNVKLGLIQSTGVVNASAGVNTTLKNNSTLTFSGESAHGVGSGSQGIKFQNFVSGTHSDITIKGAANSRLTIRNFVKNENAQGDTNTTVRILGDGIVELASASLGTGTTALQYSGDWTVGGTNVGDGAPVLSIGPIVSNSAVEILNALGYNPDIAGNNPQLQQTRPVTVVSGTLAIGADAKNPNAAASDTTTGVVRSPVTLSGGNIASTGREYSGVSPNATASSATPVTAKFGANMVLTDNTTSKVLLYEPVPMGNYNGITPTANPTGSRSVRIVTDTAPTPLTSNFTWGNGSTLVVDSGAESGGVLSFERTSGSVSVGSNATLQINAGSTVNLAGTVDALSNGTTHVNVLNNSTTSLNVTAGTKNVGTITGVGNTSVTGTATMRATAITQNTLNVANGAKAVVRARVATPNGAKVARLNNLNLNSSGTLDLNDNDLVVNNGVFSTIQGQVFGGYGTSPDTNLTGITSTVGQNTGGVAILALFNNALFGVADYPFGSGMTVGANAIVGKYTYIGDTDWNGEVNSQDYTAVDANLGTTGLDLGLAWFSGDTNFDGNIDPNDYTGIDAALGLGAGNPLSAQGLAAVPEPASLGLISVAAAGFLSRRRRR